MTEPSQLGLMAVDQSRCRHPRTERGADAPLRHGSYQTQVCTACRMFRLVGHVSQQPMSEWKAPDAYAGAVSDKDDGD